VGEPINYYNKFNFIVESEALEGRMGFMTCSPITAEVENIEHREGGGEIANNSPGLATFAPVTLTKGAADDDRLFNFFKRTFDVVKGVGAVPPELYTTLDVVQLDYAAREVKRYTLYNAWCRMFSVGDFDNSTSEKRVESIEVVYERFDISK
jgi:phage tail-like protein